MAKQSKPEQLSPVREPVSAIEVGANLAELTAQRDLHRAAARARAIREEAAQTVMDQEEARRASRRMAAERLAILLREAALPEVPPERWRRLLPPIVAAVTASGESLVGLPELGWWTAAAAAGTAAWMELVARDGADKVSALREAAPRLREVTQAAGFAAAALGVLGVGAAWHHDQDGVHLAIAGVVPFFALLAASVLTRAGWRPIAEARWHNRRRKEEIEAAQRLVDTMQEAERRQLEHDSRALLDAAERRAAVHDGRLGQMDRPATASRAQSLSEAAAPIRLKAVGGVPAIEE